MPRFSLPTTVSSVAPLCLAAFVSASVTVKYATVSTASGSRRGRSMSTSTGIGLRSAISATAASSPWSVRTCG